MKVPVFMFHEVNSKSAFPELTKYINKRYIMDPGCFKTQLEYIHSCDYNVITVSELSKSRPSNKDKSAVITFDDGYKGNYLYAFRILQKFNFRATFFITTDWIGLPNMLNWKLIKEMSEGGMEIGSHTCSHLLLARASKEKIDDELRASKAILEEKIKKPVVSISYPNGSFNALVSTIAYENGYKNACISGLGYWERGDNPLAIPRITATDNISRFRKIIEQDRSAYLKEKALEYVKKMSKTVCGEKIYNKLYFKLFGLSEIKK